MGFVNAAISKLKLKKASPHYSAAEKAGFEKDITKIKTNADSVQTAQKTQQDSMSAWDILKANSRILSETLNDKIDKTIDIWKK